jgi:Flp pilus assembly protein TadG
MVEFALVLPIFVLILAGMLDFGFALYSRMTVINAAREGAHAAITVDASNSSAINNVPALVTGAVVASADGLVTGSDVSVSCVAIVSSGPCKFLASDPGTLAQAGDGIEVTVHYSYHTFFPLFFGATLDVGSSVQMVIG